MSKHNEHKGDNLQFPNYWENCKLSPLNSLYGPEHMKAIICLPYFYLVVLVTLRIVTKLEINYLPYAYLVALAT